MRWRWPSKRLSATVLLGFVGALVALTITPPTHVDSGPVRLGLSARPQVAGGTKVDAGALGSVFLPTHRVPLQFQVVTESVNPTLVDQGANVLDHGVVVSDVKGATQLTNRDALVRGAVRAGVIALLAAGLGGAVLAGAAMRRPKSALIGGVAGLTLTAVAFGAVYVDFSRSALERPKFSGGLAYVPTAVGTVHEFFDRSNDAAKAMAGLAGQLADFQRSAVLDAGLEGLARPGAVGTTLPVGTAGTKVLVISDLHLSKAGFALARSMAKLYHVDVVVNLGDDVDWGSAEESSFLSGVAGFGVPYLWVRGNHDSHATQAAVAKAGGTVLDGRSVEVAGLRFYGVGDPTFTPKKTKEVKKDQEAVKQRWSERHLMAGIDAAEAADGPIDVLLAHDETTASALPDGRIPLILSGHFHKFALQENRGATAIQMGSTGGAGLRSFDTGKDTPLTLGVLTFDLQTRHAESLDLFTVDAFGNQSYKVQRYPLANVTAPTQPNIQRGN